MTNTAHMETREVDDMRIPSRRMPKALRRGTSVGRAVACVCLLGMIGGYLFVMWSSPVLVGLGSLVVSAVAFRQYRVDKAHVIGLANRRGAESICEFSRSFDVREMDTWVIRAVYEQLQEQLKWAHPSFPVQADDRLVEDLRLDPDDIDLDTVTDVSVRAGRSVRDTRANPFHGRVTTVGDLVAFFCAQERQQEHLHGNPATPFW